MLLSLATHLDGMRPHLSLSMREKTVFLILFDVFLNGLIDQSHCRNIRGHSRFSRPKADPHIVINGPDGVGDEEEKIKEASKHRGRRCQVTKIEEKEQFFEMPNYREGRIVLPFFIKISGKIELSKGKNE